MRDKNANVVRRLYIGFTFAIVLVLLVGCISYTTFQKQAYEAKWVQHTYRVMNVTTQIQNQVFDMEASRRGYRSTGETRFLDIYYKTLPVLPGVVDELKQLVSDNPQQSRSVSKLQYDIEELIAFWKSIPITEKTVAEKILITDQERGFVKLIREDFARVLSAEELLLNQREKANEKSINQAIWALSVGTFLILLIVIVLINLILSEFKSRKKAQEDLLENLGKQEALTQNANEKNWLLSGVSEINNRLQGVKEAKQFGSNVLDAILRYLNIPAGAFYYYDSDEKKLELYTSQGISGIKKTTFAEGEGLPGSIVAQKEIKVYNNVPADYWHIESVTGRKVPDTLIYIPLQLKGELKGLIELAVFQSDDVQNQLSMLQVVSDNIAIALDGVMATEKVERLLGQVQLQKEVLESQQEELRQSNEELTRQAEILQASEEELRVQEEELRQINAELEEKNEAVEVARQALTMKAQDLEYSSKYKSEFLANMSHELRTPLNSVLILAKLLNDNKTNNLTEKQVEYAKIIHKSGTDLLNLINDILDLSKIEAGKIDMNFEQVSVKELQYDLEQLFHVVADEKGVNLVIQTANDGPESLYTDKQRLEQVIKNLLSNAFKFTPRGGTITTNFSHWTGDQVCISVTDTGIGIPKEKQQLIFEAFQQADGSTSRKYGGTGLGLSICRELAERLGGSVILESEEGKGSTFSIIIPVGKTAAQDKKIQPSETAMPAPVEVAIPKHIQEQTLMEDDKNNIVKGEKTILIVEDDTSFASVLKTFAKGKGYKVIIAIAGDEGLYYARKYMPSAIILDMGLPVLDGRSVLKTLKNDDKLKHIPVHIISAEDASRLADVGAEGYAQKPLTLEKLEGAFANIDAYIKAHYKHVMFVMPTDTIDINEIAAFADKRHLDLEYEVVPSIEEAIAKAGTRVYDCIVVDTDDIGDDTERIKKLKDAVGEDTSVFIYLHKDISHNDELNLKRYADAVIRSSKFDKDRLIDELELFLFKIKQTEKVPVPGGVIDITGNGLEGKRVLVVDDDMRNVFALNTMLEENGLDVVTAGDGKEALELLDTTDGIDIVLMDIMMPEMDGYTAIKNIRNNNRFTKLPVIALTAKAMAEDREKCIRAGASDYITKPVDTNKLLSLMRVWLSK